MIYVSISDLGLAQYALKAYTSDNLKTLSHGLEYGIFQDAYSNKILAVQGSDKDPRDWIRNFMAFPRRDKELGFAPWGFHKASKRLADDVEKELQFDKKVNRIYVTGHSAGASIALLAAIRLVKRGYGIRRVAAFAPAKTGKRSLNVIVSLYTHGNDIVCKVPFGWSHPKELEELPDVSESVFQHSMLYYIKALDKIVNGDFRL